MSPCHLGVPSVAASAAGKSMHDRRPITIGALSYAYIEFSVWRRYRLSFVDHGTRVVNSNTHTATLMFVGCSRKSKALRFLYSRTGLQVSAGK